MSDLKVTNALLRELKESNDLELLDLRRTQLPLRPWPATAPNNKGHIPTTMEWARKLNMATWAF